jgi:tetratricopeptide (TPR) repeat protein
MKLKLIIICALAVLVIAGGWYYFTPRENKTVNNQGNQSGKVNLDEVRSEFPELSPYIDDIIKCDNILKEEKDKLENYAALGLAWKSLADRTKNPEHYQRALGVYEEAIEKTGGQNGLYWLNAGNMENRLKNYQKAEEYYLKAIGVAPAETTYYFALADLYEYQLNKSKEAIVAVYDQGISQSLFPEALEKRKEQYLKRV